MLMNLFSSFDPTTNFLFSGLGLNWISSCICLILMPYSFLVKLNRYQMSFINLVNNLSNEFKLVMTGKKISSYYLFISLFIFILFNNFMGLFPYIFTSSSHLVFTFMFSLMFWLSFMIFGWLKNTNMMFSHLVPVGTPTLLMPLLVCIESISNFIRSGTLSIRLTANMISGHLLLTLIGNQGSSLPFFLTLVLIFVQSLLMILEISVSMIQAYVFSILSSLYSSEVNHHWGILSKLLTSMKQKYLLCLYLSIYSLTKHYFVMVKLLYY